MGTSQAHAPRAGSTAPTVDAPQGLGADGLGGLANRERLDHLGLGGVPDPGGLDGICGDIPTEEREIVAWFAAGLRRDLQP